MSDWPAIPLFCFLVVIAGARGGATYAIARGVRQVADRRTGLPDRAVVRRAEQVVERYGAVAVALCFLTVGVQTAVNAAAGSLRMPLRRYLPALLVGALIWATLYVTVGLAVLEAVWGGRPWVLPVALVVIGLVAWGAHRWFVRSSDSPDDDW